MAVYTHITEGELSTFLALYDSAPLRSFEGIAQGVSNTNYHVFTQDERYVLTIFEAHRVNYDDLPFFFAYAAHLNAKGVSCPQALLNKDGSPVTYIQGKAAALIEFLPGKDIPRGETSADHCAQAGGFLARMHLAVEDFPQTRVNDWGVASYPARIEKMAAQIQDFDRDVYEQLQTALPQFEALLSLGFPQGVCHLDLFPDNVFFDSGRVSAMIDMYFAASEWLLLDLAITMNAWCLRKNGTLDLASAQAFLAAYRAERLLSQAEEEAFPLMLQAACVRFLLSRLEEWFAYDPQKTTMSPHDPMDYARALKHYQDMKDFAWLSA